MTLRVIRDFVGTSLTLSNSGKNPEFYISHRNNSILIKAFFDDSSPKKIGEIKINFGDGLRSIHHKTNYWEENFKTKD